MGGAGRTSVGQHSLPQEAVLRIRIRGLFDPWIRDPE